MSNGVRSALKVQQAEPAPAPRVSVRSAPRVQPSSLRLSQPGDAGEREADRVAGQVMAMPDGAAHGGMIAARERIPLLAARAPAGSISAASGENVASDVASEIRSLAGSGTPLRTETRRFMEPRFRANFSDVRVHTGGKAASLASRLGAAAFTHGRDVVFGKGAYRPESDEGKRLIAHELTHTIQQGGVSGRVHRSIDTAPVTVQERSGLQVQRGIVSRALDWIADKANYIPGFRLLTIVIGRNPINMAAVDRSGENILRAMIEFIPGGPKIAEALQNHGVLQKGGKFIEAQFAALADLGGSIRDALMQFVDSLGLTDLASPGDVWERAKLIFTAPVDRAIAFGRNLVSGIAEIVKEAIIKPLGAWAKSNVPKWDLLVGVFGKNPISEEGESPASALIGAFMELIGQGEIWENIKKGNAVARAWQWFQTAMKGAKALVTGIPGRVVATIRSLTIFDIVTIVGAFAKIAGAFGSFVGDFMRWAGGTVLNLLEIILSVVAPAVVPYLKKAGGAFSTIIRNPMGFVRTLVAAGKAGFNQFAGNFLEHLKASLIGWLTGAMGGAGIYIPQGLNFREILKFALSVMGLTWNNIRAKLVAATNETTVKALETGFDLVKTLVTEGPAAAWQQLMETLSNLKQMAIDAVMDFVKSRVVQAAVTKLLSMLSPAGAFIQAIIAIYNTVMFFVERLRQIAAVAASFIDGIAAIAAGNIAPAAARVERTLAGLLTLVISFLARIAGLGKVSDAIIGLINKIRAPIDKALDKVVAWIVNKAKALGKMAGGKGSDLRTSQEKEIAVKAAQDDGNKLVFAQDATEQSIEKGLSTIKQRHKLTSISLLHEGSEVLVEVTINPSRKTKKRKFDPTKMVVGDVVIIRHVQIRMKGSDKITWIPGTATAVDQAKQTFDWASSNLETRRTWAKIPFSAQDEKWKKGHISQVKFSDVKMLELNEKEQWKDFTEARAILNWRHHEAQTNAPGKQWEHIIEQFSGGANSSGNLALSAATVNNRLGKMFGKAYALHEAPTGMKSTNGLPLREALKSEPLYAHNRWKQFFYTQLGVALRWSKSVRGIWRELS